MVTFTRQFIGVGICLSALLLVACGERQAFREAYRTQDYATAYELIVPAAERGDADAQYYLGTMYRNGYGVEANMIEAYKWFAISRATAFDFYGDLASTEVARLQEEMSPEDIATGERLSREWLASRPVQ